MYKFTKRITSLILIIFFASFGLSQNDCGCTNCPVNITDNGNFDAEIFIQNTGPNILGGDNCLTEVCFTVNHTWIGDLDFTLIAPDGTCYIIMGDANNGAGGCGSSCDNIDVCIQVGTGNPAGTGTTEYASLTGGGGNCVSGNYTIATGVTDPNGPCGNSTNNLDAFNNGTGTVSGTWTLNVGDNCNFDTGQLTDWSLGFCDESGISCSSDPLCIIDYFEANISACVTGTGTYDVTGVVDFTDPPTTGNLVVEDCFGTQHIIASAPFPNPGSVNYTINGLPADGANCDLTTYFTADLTCVNGPLNYTAPTCPCNFTFISTNISACDPTNNTFEITGSVEFENPPGTGTLTVTDCNGNQQVFNAPFTSPTNYALTGIDSDGTPNCDVTATFSDDPTCTINIGPFDYPASCMCTAEIGTFTDGVTGDANSAAPWNLCFGDELNITGNGDVTLPQDFNVGGVTYDPGVWLLVYSCPPSVFPPNDINTDPCLLGVASTADQAWTIINNAGDNSTLYYAPITMYSMVDGIYAISLNNGDWCYDLGPSYQVTFLQEITTTQTQDCQAATATVTINGGLPSFDGSLFTATNLTPASAVFNNTTAANGGTITISGLVDGDNWSFDITDGNGCPVTVSGTFTGIEDPSFTYPDNVYCETQLDPSPTITGTPGGTFTAAPAGLTIDAASGLIDLSSATGTFTITYTTPDPVCFDSQDFIITINPEPIIDPLANQIACDSYTLPVITGTNLTGNEAYYTGPGGTGTQLIPGNVITTVGTTTLYIYDETGTVPNCFDEVTFTVTINLTPVIDPLANQIACDSYTLPAITGTNLTGGEAYYTGIGGTGTQLLPGNAITTAGTTTLYIYDETGTTPNCFDEQTFTVTINLTPVIDPLANQIACDSYTLPAITGTNLTGGEAYYTGIGGTGTQLLPGNAITTAGTTTLYIYDETGTTPNCFDEQSFTVTINLTPIIDPLANQVECDSYTLPAITGANLTGSEAYYTGIGGTGTQLLPGNAITTTGTTTLYIYDETGTTPNCFDEQTFTVTINLTPVIDPLANQVECDAYTLPAITGTNLTGGEAYYTGTGGTGTLFNAGNAITTAGTTTLYIYDETGTTPNCFDEQTFDVTINITPTFTLSSTDPTACGVADGTITLSGLEPNTTYDITYSTGGTPIGPNAMTSDAAGDIVITGLAAGSYADFVVTLNGCTTTDNTSINLVEPNAPAVDAGADQQVCDGTAVTLTANNPDGANITWDNGVTDGVAFNPTVGVTNYTVTADLAGCISTDQVTVTVYAVPVIDPLANQVECDSYTLPAITGTNLTGGEAYYTGTGGTGTQLLPGDVITTAGTTTLFIYDETGTTPNCFDEQTFDVTINLTPAIDPLADQVECDSYTLPVITGTNLTGTEAYYTGTGGTGTQINAGDAFTTAGTTTLYIYDETATAPNCFDEQTFDVTINLTPAIDPLANQVECDSYTLPAITGTNLTGGETYYTGTGGSGTQLNTGDVITTAGTTTLFIYDETGTTPNCFNEQTFDVTINLTPVIDPLANQVECDSYTLPVITGTNLTGGEAYFTGTGGTGTQLGAGSAWTTPGTTTLYIYDETGTTPNCFDEQTFDVTINITPTFTLSSTDPTACGAADGTITISGLEPNTTYDITYSDDSTPIGPNAMNSDAVGDIVIGGLTAGSYSDFVVTLNGCTTTDNSSINLVDPNAPAVNAGPNQEICEGEQVTLTADNPDGANISWSNGVTDGVAFTPSVGTVTYTVTADLLGCISTDQVDVTVHPNPTVFAGNDVLICEEESVTLTGSGADSYVWDNGVTNGVSFNPTTTQTYTVVGTTNEGCQGTDDVVVTIEPLPSVSFEADNLEGCVPVTVTFTNTSSTPGNECIWNFGDGSTAMGCEQVTHTFNNVGCFDVTLQVTSANGCTSSSTTTDYICVGGYPIAAFDFSPDQLTTIATEAQFANNSTGAIGYEWNFGDGQTSTDVNPSHEFPAVEDTFYVELIATSPFGCKDTAYAAVPIFEELIFYVPNTFTPDNDEYNEVFKPIFTSGFDPFSYNLLIFNRWGEVIFESNNSEVGWDGTYGVESDQLVKDGTYVWKITFKTKISDERIVKVGHVNVLK